MSAITAGPIERQIAERYRRARHNLAPSHPVPEAPKPTMTPRMAVLFPRPIVETGPAAPEPQWKAILRRVALKHRVTVAEIVGPSRVRHLAAARHEACFYLYVEAGLSLERAGHRLGDRDHTTVRNSIHRFIRKRPELAKDFEDARLRRPQSKSALRMAALHATGLSILDICERTNYSAAYVRKMVKLGMSLRP